MPRKTESRKFDCISCRCQRVIFEDRRCKKCFLKYERLMKDEREREEKWKLEEMRKREELEKQEKEREEFESWKRSVGFKDSFMKLFMEDVNKRLETIENNIEELEERKVDPQSVAEELERIRTDKETYLRDYYGY